MKFGSTSVPVYRSESKGRVRFMLCSYRDGKRICKIFNSLDEAKKEALLVAQRIQSGMQHVTDMKPHERDHHVKAAELLSTLDLSRVAAVEDSVQARNGRLVPRAKRPNSTAETAGLGRPLGASGHSFASTVMLDRVKYPSTAFGEMAPASTNTRVTLTPSPIRINLRCNPQIISLL